MTASKSLPDDCFFFLTKIEKLKLEAKTIITEIPEETNETK